MDLLSSHNNLSIYLKPSIDIRAALMWHCSEFKEVSNECSRGPGWPSGEKTANFDGKIAFLSYTVHHLRCGYTACSNNRSYVVLDLFNFVLKTCVYVYKICSINESLPYYTSRTRFVWITSTS